ncbi:glucuronate isomerase [Prosthecobacter sp.]|uniref:glucuronate isomerase n=1 Tax=Prosthecobacter sp. TaxID=1965333 RepID=UPI002AB95591|nr:glucuronate isomerase [Prosthecobacter sp.]MDZ4403425.1 glucuronate isomerase [Prosthecobacter sp.]
MSFIHDNFLLSTQSASRLYHTFAKDEPILDYHNHLPPKDIAQNRQFKNLFEIWLEGDHYKWRAMRCNGVPEEFITGKASPRDKFMAWAKTVPQTLRNPLYHWTHLELKRYFGIDTLLDEKTAPAIWEQTEAALAQPEMSTRGILRTQKVKALCTTDDPIDDLAWHRQCAADGFEVGVYPTFRPDKALAVHQPEAWSAWCDKLSAASGIEVKSYASLLDALKQRHDFFHSVGGRLSDHGLNYCHANFVSDAEAERIFQKARSGSAASAQEQDQFASNVMLHVGRLNASRGWTMQLHLGPVRNNNSRLAREIGADVGCDSIGDYPQAETLSRFLDRLDTENALPKTVLYNVNPAHNYVFGTMAGNFADGTTPGKVQFGSAWWFVDQKEGMEWQINALSNLGLLSRFIGMLTDSRSFMSFPRHEYFRRTLCNLLGADIESGAIPNDDALVGTMVKNICYANAQAYLGLKVA